jgi:hypothetical protein
MGRLWTTLLVCLGFATGAQAVPIVIELPVTVTGLSDWENNPYAPPNDLAIGDTGTIGYHFDDGDLAQALSGCGICSGDLTLVAAPWTFQATFDGAALAGSGGGGSFALLYISLTDGPTDVLRIAAVEDDFSFHILELRDPGGTAISAGDLASPLGFFASLDPRSFSEASWRLETQPGAVVEGIRAIPEPAGAVLFSLGIVLALGRLRLRCGRTTRF